MKFLLSSSFCVVLLAPSAWAKDVSSATNWLTAEQERSLSETVPPPPAVGSAEDKADYAQILTAQKERTPEIIAECIRNEDFSYKPFENVYGLRQRAC